MPPCPPGSMLHSCAEVRERIDPDCPAANHTLPAALVQDQGTGASETMEDTLRPRSTEPKLLVIITNVTMTEKVKRCST